MKSIGIDIGGMSIKVAEVVSTSQGFVLKDFVELPLSPEPGQDQRIEIVDHLRKISAHYANSGVKYVMALPQEKLSVRSLVCPTKERHTLIRSLPSQLEEDIPLTQEDSIFDAKILRYSGTRAEVLAIACRKKHIQELLTIAHEAGIDPEVVSVDGPSLSNTFEGWLQPPKEIENPKNHRERLANQEIDPETLQSPETEEVPPAQLLVHIGHRRTILNVLYRNTLLDSRTISRGGHDIVEALRRQYNLPYIEALKGLQERGFVLTTAEGASQDQIEFSNTVSESLKPLIDDIKITLIELRSQLEIDFDQVYLSGGVSRLMNMAPFLTKELELPSNLLGHMDRIPKDFSSDSSAMEHSSLVAISLALEGLKRPRNPAINLLKDEFGKQNQSIKNFWKRWGYTIKYASVILVLMYVFSFTRDFMAATLNEAGTAKYQNTAKETFQLKGRAASETRAAGFIKNKRKEIEGKKELERLQSVNSALDIVSLLSERFPAKTQVQVDIRRLLVNGESVIVEGEVSQRNHVELIRAALTASSLDKKVKEFKPSISPTDGKMAFAFELSMERKKQ